MGKATILGFSPNLAAMISSGGRISTMEGTAGQIWQKSLELGEEKNERLIGKVVSIWRSYLDSDMLERIREADDD